MKRAIMLKQAGIMPVFVFDGGKMPGKAGEYADRKMCARLLAKIHNSFPPKTVTPP